MLLSVLQAPVRNTALAVKAVAEVERRRRSLIKTKHINGGKPKWH